MVNVDFCLLEFSTTKIVTWKCHVEKYATGRNDIILGRDLLTALVLDLNFLKTSYMAEKDHTKGIPHLWLTQKIMILIL